MPIEKLRKKVTKSQTQKWNWRNTKKGRRATEWSYTQGHLVYNMCAIPLNLRIFPSHCCP